MNNKYLHQTQNYNQYTWDALDETSKIDNFIANRKINGVLGCKSLL